MKAVMLTFDYSVDRRIILEAESLTRAGIEVVIIASPLTQAGGAPLQGRTRVEIKRIGTDFDPRGADPLLKLYFRFLKKLFAKVPFLIPAMRAAYFHFKTALGSDPRKDPFLLLPNAWAFHGAAVAEQPDLCFAHDLPMLPVAHRVSQDTGARLLYDAHEFWPGLSELSRREAKICREIESAYINKADIVTTVNELLADEFRASYGRKPEVLMNCVDWAAGPRTDVIRRRLGLPPRAKILLYQGGFLPYRNLDLLVRSSVRFAPGIVLVMLGFGVLKDGLVKIARKKGVLGSTVFFLDPVGYEELRSYTASADAGIIPYAAIDTNTRFCTPNKLFEYIGAGVPVLANDLPAVRQILEQDRIGRIAVMDDEQSMAKSVNEFFRDRDTLESFRRNLAAVHAKYSWEEQGSKLVRLVLRAGEKGAS